MLLSAVHELELAQSSTSLLADQLVLIHGCMHAEPQEGPLQIELPAIPEELPFTGGASDSLECFTLRLQRDDSAKECADLKAMLETLCHRLEAAESDLAAAQMELADSAETLLQLEIEYDLQRVRLEEALEDRDAILSAAEAKFSSMHADQLSLRGAILSLSLQQPSPASPSSPAITPQRFATPSLWDETSESDSESQGVGVSRLHDEASTSRHRELDPLRPEPSKEGVRPSAAPGDGLRIHGHDVGRMLVGAAVQWLDALSALTDSVNREYEEYSHCWRHDVHGVHADCWRSRGVGADLADLEIELVLTKRDLDLTKASIAATATGAGASAVIPFLDSIVGLSTTERDAADAKLEGIRTKYTSRICELHAIIDRLEQALRESRRVRSKDAEQHCRAIKTFLAVLRKAKDALGYVEVADGPQLCCPLFHAEIDRGIRELSCLSPQEDEAKKERPPIIVTSLRLPLQFRLRGDVHEYVLHYPHTLARGRWKDLFMRAYSRLDPNLTSLGVLMRSCALL
jgi:hypothetical protein